LGCSHSFGIGLPFEETWAVKVSRSLGLRCVNLAWPGSSNDTTFRTAYNYIKKINPEIVIFLSPAPARFDLVINDTSLITFLPADGKSPSDPDPDPAFCKFYETWVLSDSNILLNRIKNTLAIKQLCQENNIKFVSHRVEDIAPVDLARDLIHSGVKTNTNLANSILKKI
jgi:hypothetical protein